MEEIRQKIASGELPLVILEQKQNQHIFGTEQFEQRRVQELEKGYGQSPSYLIVDAKSVVDKYAGTGEISFRANEKYLREEIVLPEVAGYYWGRKEQKYFPTNKVKLVYSQKGVHVYPIFPGGD